MTEEQKKIKQYMTAIENQLQVPPKMTARISSDLGTDFHARMETGKTAEQVMEEMGTPRESALRINQEFLKENQTHTGTGRKAGILCCLGALLGLLAAIWLVIPLTRAIETNAWVISAIGGADGPTAIFIAGKVNTVLDVILQTLSLLAAVGVLVLLSGSNPKILWIKRALRLEGIGFLCFILQMIIAIVGRTSAGFFYWAGRDTLWLIFYLVILLWGCLRLRAIWKK